ncbi:uncharacterized protein [Primulina huaijiensis]|uniref:uncharacterized protein n=1 Tax=Primulina huaijiensis TaxID=1492673 RepID=UPI003CC75325
MGQEVLAKRLVVNCLLEFEGKHLSANLMILAMEDFDCIMGIVLLTKSRATVDYYQRLVQFRPEGDENWFFFGEGARPPMPIVSAVKAQQALATGGEGYLIYAVDVSKDVIDVKNIPVVDEFPYVFPGEIPGFPPEREVEVEIELVPGTAPISRASYRLAPSEMKELKQQLQDLLDKGYIRPSVSPWRAPVLFVKKKYGSMRLCIDYRQLNRFEWTHDCENSFNELRQRLTTAPVLALPSGSGGYIVYTDASLQGLREAQFFDPKVKKLTRSANGYNTSGFAFQTDGTLCLSGRIVVPEDSELRDEILSQAHRIKLSTHPGSMKTYKDLKTRVMRFGLKGKLAPIFIGPFEILECVGNLAYRLALPPYLSSIHNVFHVSLLRRYVADE